MAITDTDIGKMCLAHMGITDPINDLASDQTPNAKTIRLFYDIARQAALEAFDWPFARVYTALSSSNSAAAAIPTPYAYEFKKPIQALAVRSVVIPGVGPPARPIDFDMGALIDGTQVIRTKVPGLYAWITVDEKNPARWTPLFILTFSYFLAFYCTPGIKEDEKMANKFWGLAQQHGAMAQVSVANQQSFDLQDLQNVSWHESRNS